MTAFTVFFLPFFECSYLRYFAGKKYVRPKSLVCTSQVRQRTSRTWDFTRVRQPRKHKRGHREHSKISFLVSTYSSLTYVFSFILPLHLAKTQTRLDFFAFCLRQLQERTGKGNLSNKCFNCTRKLALCLLMNQPYFVILLVLFESFLFALFWISKRAEYCNGSSQLFLFISCVIKLQTSCFTGDNTNNCQDCWRCGIQNLFLKKCFQQKTVYGVTKKHPTRLLWSPFAKQFASMCLHNWNGPIGLLFYPKNIKCITPTQKVDIKLFKKVKISFKSSSSICSADPK